MKSIQTKIISIFSTIIILTVIFSSLTSELMLNSIYDFTSNLLNKQIAEREEIVDKTVKSMEEDIIRTSLMIASQLSGQQGVKDGIKANDKNMVHDAMKESSEIAKKEAGIDLIWVTRLSDRTSEGNTPILACPTNPNFDGFDKLNYESTNEALTSGKTVVSWEVNEEDGKLQVTAPVIDSGKVIGAVVVGRQTYQSFIKKIADVCNTGSTLFLINKDDYYVMTDSQTDEIGNLFFNDSHEKLKDKAKNLSSLKNDSKLYTPISPLLEKVRSSKEVLIETVNLEGSPYVIYLRPLVSYNGDVRGIMLYRFPGIVASKAEFMSKVNRIRVIFYTIAVLLILLSIAASYILTRRITKPLKELQTISRKISEGDFTERAKIRSRDEIGKLGNTFNEMITGLGMLVSKIGESSTHIASTAETLNVSSGQNSKATEQIASTVQTIARGASVQAEMVSDTYSLTTELSRHMNQISTNAQSVSNSSLEATRVAKEGDNQIQTAMAQMKIINDAVSNSANVVTELGEKSKQIGQIIDAITSIAEQTNLLSLNAAIEAARAGEHGKGFAVVAEEVRKLAEQSSRSSKDISQIVTEIQRETVKAVETMKDGKIAVSKGIEVVNNAGLAFDKIMGAIDDVSNNVQQVSKSLKEMALYSEKVFDDTEKVLEIAKNSSTDINTIASAVEEQTAAMEEIASMANSLSSMSDGLKGLIKKFKYQ